MSSVRKTGKESHNKMERGKQVVTVIMKIPLIVDVERHTLSLERLLICKLGSKGGRVV